MATIRKLLLQPKFSTMMKTDRKNFFIKAIDPLLEDVSCIFFLLAKSDLSNTQSQGRRKT